MSFCAPDQHRDSALGLRLYGDSGDDCNGVFCIPSLFPGRMLRCIASNGDGWEHVSVSVRRLRGKRRRSRLDQLPLWEEMCQVKGLFWAPSDCVVQYHPPDDDSINNAEVLHLWRRAGSQFETPDPWLVGIPGVRLERGAAK